jgi:hypothetical protein
MSEKKIKNCIAESCTVACSMDITRIQLGLQEALLTILVIKFMRSGTCIGKVTKSRQNSEIYNNCLSKVSFLLRWLFFLRILVNGIILDFFTV